MRTTALASRLAACGSLRSCAGPGPDLRRGDQDRRAQRPVRPLRRPRRPGLGGRGADGGRGLRRGEVGGMQIEVISADHQNKPDVGSEHRAPVVRRRQGRRRSSTCRPRRSRWRSARSRATRTRSSSSRAPAPRDLTGKACSPEHRPLDLRHLGARQRHRQGGGRRPAATSWFFLTADYAFGQALERDTDGGGRKAAAARCWARSATRSSTTDFSSFLLQAQASKAQGHRARQRRRRHDQLDQAGRASSASSRAARSSPACSSSSPTSTRSGSRPRRA